MGSCCSIPAEDDPENDVEVPERVWRSDEYKGSYGFGDPEINRKSLEFIEEQRGNFNNLKVEALTIPNGYDQVGDEAEILWVESSNGDEASSWGDPFVNGKSDCFIQAQHERFNNNSCVDESLNNSNVVKNR